MTDGYRQCERTRTQVEVLRQLLDEHGVAELGFAVDPRGGDDAGYTWAILVDSDDSSEMHRLAWEAFTIALCNRNDPIAQQFRESKAQRDAPGKAITPDQRNNP